MADQNIHKRKACFSESRSILFIGEGNFSFCFAVAKASPHLQLVCTGFDSEEILLTRYPESVSIISKLKALENVRGVIHGVNATLIHSNIEVGKLGPYDDIIFTHPHVGIEDAKLHRSLLAHFMHSAKLLFNQNNNGESSNKAHIEVSHISGVNNNRNNYIHITLAEAQPDNWSLFSMASLHGLELKSRTEFEDRHFNGYMRKRTLNSKSFVSRASKSFTFSFEASHPKSSFEIRPPNLPCMNSIDSNSHREVLPWYHMIQAQGSIENQNNRKEKIVKQRKTEYSVHMDTSNLRCIACNKTFRNLQGLRTHDHQVHVLKLYETSEIKHDGNKKEDFKRTEEGRDGSSPPPPPPPSSSSSSSSSTTTSPTSCCVKEPTDITLIKTDSYSCVDCARAFTSSSALKQHQLSMHIGVFQHTKPDWFATRQSLTPKDTKNQRSEIEGSETQLNHCDHCSICEQNITDMDDHIRHLQPKKDLTYLCCDGCGKQFMEERALRQHANYCATEGIQ